MLSFKDITAMKKEREDRRKRTSEVKYKQSCQFGLLELARRVIYTRVKLKKKRAF